MKNSIKVLACVLALGLASMNVEAPGVAVNVTVIGRTPDGAK